MVCSLARRLLALHAGGDLPETLARSIGGHCAACAACGAELRSLEAARRPLSRLAALERAEDARPRDVSVKADPLGDNFWIGIRRDLRGEGLVRGPAEEAGPFKARRRPAIGRYVSGGLAARVALATAAAMLAGFIFLPGRIGVAPEAPPDPGLAAFEAPGARPFERVATAPTRRPSAVRGASVFPATVRGALEETEPYAPPELEFGVERWRDGSELPDGAPRSADKDDEKAKGTLSF